MKLPRYDDLQKKGEEGITIVKRIIEKDLNWIFRKNNLEYDFGIDAYIDLISEVGQITGKSVAIQIKTGQSYFTEKNENGWVYRGELKHLNYYLNHDIPVIIVIVDDLTEKAYWSLCDADKTEKAGENWKMTIPYHKELNSHSKVELQKYISPIYDYASQLEHFWQMNKMLQDQQRIVFIVDGPDIINNKYSYLIDAFKRLEVNPELLKASKGKVDVWIHGYNDDPRELYEIEEIKNWVKIVFEEIQGWAYFLTMDKAAQFLRVMELCNVKYRLIKKGSIKKKIIEMHKVEIDLKSSEAFLYALFDDLNKFCDKHSIPEEINKEISFSLVEYLSGHELDQKFKNSYKT